MNAALKKYFLIISSIIVGVIALIYGISPSWFCQTFFGMDTLDINFSHLLRAVMCLYLALGLFWLASAMRPKLHNIAIVTVIVFCSGLLLGRLMSFTMDGLPSPLLQIYAGIELSVIPVALWLLKRRDV